MTFPPLAGTWQCWIVGICASAGAGTAEKPNAAMTAKAAKRNLLFTDLKITVFSLKVVAIKDASLSCACPPRLTGHETWSMSPSRKQRNGIQYIVNSKDSIY